ncbi:MAG: preprotein translocase subunit SecE [Gemmatimonadales bacterium]|nr:preprotein translocase subunit SecE [Gemmatimonadota bacterium]MCC7134513.1 preprotein translocase subunit SecE [Gemmatimonadales bacterium]MDX2060952.1 preprotein translocase subunit SecE [Gemmatimonadales bacterium]
MEQVEATTSSPNKLVGGAQAFRDFLVDVRAEMKKVSWPTKDELLDATKRVVIMTVAIGTVIGLLDLALKKILVDGVAALTR